MKKDLHFTIICEGSRDESFIRSCLVGLGFNQRRFRVVKAPKGEGSGEHWVREQYADKIEIQRQKNYQKRLVTLVMLDEDTDSTAKRELMLKQSLANRGLAPRSASEKIVHLIPARNIETWLFFLSEHQEVNEKQDHKNWPSLQRQRMWRKTRGELQEEAF